MAEKMNETIKEQRDGRLIMLSRLILTSSLLLLIPSVVLFDPALATDFWLAPLPRLIFAISLVTANGFVGLLIISRYPKHVVGWLLLVLAFSYGLDEFTTTIFTHQGASFADLPLIMSTLQNNAWADPIPTNLVLLLLIWFGSWGWYLQSQIFNLFVPLFFPDGRLLSKRWRIVAFAAVLSTVLGVISITLYPQITEPSAGAATTSPAYVWASILYNYVTVPLGAFILGSIILSIYLRYRRSEREQRAQIKWVIYVIVMGLVFNILPYLYSQIWPVADQETFDTFSYTLFYLFSIALPVAIGIAILRYHLYDIDIIIRRTLVYSLVTVTLALVYFGSVVLLQRLFTGATGQSSPLAIVLSTLLIAALFNPLRRRVQDTIDRRFYRRKYDAQQVLARFAGAARDEPDRERLVGELSEVIQETLQPDNLSIWVKK
jgi:hypothetical protein